MPNDIEYYGIRGMRRFDAYKDIERKKKYKVLRETYCNGRIEEYFIIGPDGIWAEGYDNPKAAVAEVLAVIPGIKAGDIEM